MSNVGTIDRILRAMLGVALIVAPLLASAPTLWLASGIAVGAILVATSAFSFCPIYALLGLSSKRARRT
jgi:hypothetical protein